MRVVSELVVEFLHDFYGMLHVCVSLIYQCVYESGGFLDRDEELSATFRVWNPGDCEIGVCVCKELLFLGYKWCIKRCYVPPPPQRGLRSYVPPGGPN